MKYFIASILSLILSSLCFAEPVDLVNLKPVQVAQNTYFVQGFPEMGSSKNQNFISNAGFVETPTGVVVVDALGSPALAQKLLNEIAKITKQKVVAVIVTHYHADHIYGLQVFKKAGAKIYAQELSKDYLNSDPARQRLESSRIDFAPWVNSSTHLVTPDLWIKSEKSLTVGGVDFLISKVGPAHTSEDLMVYVPSESVLFVGDLVFRGRIPFVGNADSKGWLASLDRIEGLKPKIVIPGHGAYSPDPVHDVAFTREYLRYLRSSMGEAARNMDSFDVVYTKTDWSEYEGMPLFRSANRMNAYNVYLSIQGE
ncbi:MBL fold metallo-hydrolase [Polynucleobacter sp. Latsch14-2]|uniref:MBL fold metallo-hydrolase n=1 Tax=Polynucleobacter sp. Latsch14-2 TaxID=2576920 RepID=UPI001C0E3103|nr:MBL fold metallo-hydrolase [Polynucleobacter sp. Latsch14-2]MBU3614595.1 MBL fold metallo-hydrolase [Polynucleobacter sp. Latsch14-2]